MKTSFRACENPARFRKTPQTPLMTPYLVMGQALALPSRQLTPIPPALLLTTLPSWPAADPWGSSHKKHWKGRSCRPLSGSPAGKVFPTAPSAGQRSKDTSGRVPQPHSALEGFPRLLYSSVWSCFLSATLVRPTSSSPSFLTAYPQSQRRSRRGCTHLHTAAQPSPSPPALAGSSSQTDIGRGKAALPHPRLNGVG